MVFRKNVTTMKKKLIIVVTLIVLAIAGLLTYNLLYTPYVSNRRACGEKKVTNTPSKPEPEINYSALWIT